MIWILILTARPVSNTSHTSYLTYWSHLKGNAKVNNEKLRLSYHCLSPKCPSLDLIFVAWSVAVLKARTLIKSPVREVPALNTYAVPKRRAILKNVYLITVKYLVKTAQSYERIFNWQLACPRFSLCDSPSYFQGEEFLEWGVKKHTSTLLFVCLLIWTLRFCSAKFNVTCETKTN